MHSGVRKVLVCLAFAGAILSPSASQALIGTIDDVPAATLLLPYFEVDLDNADGINTLLSINNASATAILAHVTLWSDLSVHVLDFSIYLTGYDVQTLNLKDLLVNRNAPRTAGRRLHGARRPRRAPRRSPLPSPGPTRSVPRRATAPATWRSPRSRR